MVGPPRSTEEPRRRVDSEHPIGGEISDIVLGLFRRAQLQSLLGRHSSITVMAAFSFINGCLSIAIMSLAALATSQPLVFPSLGPTAFLCFFTPTTAPASPRNTIYGHAIGAAAGWASLWAFGLEHAGPALSVGVTWQRVFAAALSLGLTSGLMVIARAPHPPAGATTLIISLGLLPHLEQLGVLMFAVVLLVIQAIIINRLAGIPYPLWAAPQPSRPSAQ
ncbi:HPP family protein [bacterium]|nr:HPP family protein [bacterium]